MANEYTDNLPQFAYSAQQVQQYEAKAAKLSGTDLSTLMQRAGAAAFRFIENSQPKSSHILIITVKAIMQETVLSSLNYVNRLGFPSPSLRYLHPKA